MTQASEFHTFNICVINQFWIVIAQMLNKFSGKMGYSKTMLKTSVSSVRVYPVTTSELKIARGIILHKDVSTQWYNFLIEI